MTLVVDKRESAGGEPGLHALLLGVSSYRHLPGGSAPRREDTLDLRQLSSAALSAYRLAEWLRRPTGRLARPLTTLRLLVAPSEAELAAEPALEEAAAGCTLDQVQDAASDWRDDASADREGMTIFYFAGHGIDRSKGDSVLLLEDFADGRGGVLDKAINARNVHNGMAPTQTRANIARSQLYLLDACRDESPRLWELEATEPSAVWSPERGGEDTRHAPTLYATVPGASAYGRRGGTTLFAEALIGCLEGAAADLIDVDGEEVWRVGSDRLNLALRVYLRELAGQAGVTQEYRSDNMGGDFVINELGDPPTVPIEITIKPEPAVDLAAVSVLDDAGAPALRVPKPLQPHPFHFELPAGYYAFGADVEPPDPRFPARPPRSRIVRPPRHSQIIQLGAP
jgi:caspase domain-containing protein